jgi:hypothetical protein
MKVGDLVRDVCCGTLYIVKELREVKRTGLSYVIVWSFSGNEEISISDNLELVE